MRAINWVGLGSLGVVVVSLAAACGSDTATIAESGQAGAGAAPDVETPNARAGNGGAPDVGMPSESGGGRGDPRTECGDIGPPSSLSPLRGVVPVLDITQRDAGAGAGGSAGDANAEGGAAADPPEPMIAGSGGDGSVAPPAEGCRVVPGESAVDTIECVGTARVIGDGPVFELGAARVAWSSVPIDPPAVRTGDSVWLRYRRAHPVVCPFCGTYTEAALEVRHEVGGELLWYGVEGHRTEPPSEELLSELFGDAVERQPRCEAELDAGCYTFSRTSLEHLLLTSPSQPIPHATVTEVSASGGDFQVFWTESADSKPVLDERCSDGPAPAFDNSFAVSRRRD